CPRYPGPFFHSHNGRAKLAQKQHETARKPRLSRQIHVNRRHFRRNFGRFQPPPGRLPHLGVALATTPPTPQPPPGLFSQPPKPQPPAPALRAPPPGHHPNHARPHH